MIPEDLAARIMLVAVAEGRAAEFVTCLMEGGSATVNAEGQLVLLTAEMLLRLGEPPATVG